MAPASVRIKPGRGCSIATSRSASAGGMRPARRAAAATASCADRDAHGERRGQRDQRVPGREPGADLAAVDEHADDGVGERAPGEQPERARDQRHQQRLARDQAAHLPWRRAERAQDGRLAPPLGDREGERAGDDEQGDRARDPAERPEDRDQPGAVGRGRVARVRVRGVAGVEDVHAVAQPLREPAVQVRRGRPTLGDHADRVDAPRPAGQPPGDGVGEEQRRLAGVAGAARRRRSR